jgi:tetratricopeptide (TPR) repeat protein
MQVRRKHPIRDIHDRSIRRHEAGVRAHAALCVGLFVALTSAAAVVSGVGCAPVAGEGPPAASIEGARRASVTLDDLAPAISRPANRPEEEALPSSVEETLSHARQMLDASRPLDALKDVASLGDQLASDPRVVRLSGMAHLQRRDYSAAADELARAAAADGDDIEVQVSLGIALANSGHGEQAAAALRTALVCSASADDNPLTAEAYLWLSNVLTNEGYYTAALDCLTRLEAMTRANGRPFLASRSLRPLVLNPERLLIVRANLLSKLKRDADAADVLAEVMGYDLSQTEPARMLVEALLNAREYSRAEAFIAEIANEPDQQAQLPDLAERVCLRSRDADTPARLAEALLARHALDGPTAVRLAQAADALNRPDNACRILQDMLDAQPGVEEVAKSLAERLARCGLHMQALWELASLISRDPSATGAVDDAVRMIARLDAPADIEYQFSSGIAGGDLPEGVEPAGAYYVAGRLADQFDQRDLATDLYQRSLQADPRFRPPYYAQADALIALDEQPRLNRLVARAAAALPGSGLAEYLAARSLIAQGKYSKAVEKLAIGAKDDPSDAATLLLWGETLMHLGRFGQAAPVLARAVALDETDERAYLALFGAYVATRQYDQAAALVDMLAKNVPGSAAATVLRARLAIRRGDVEEARKCLDALVAARPENPSVGLLRVELALSQGDRPVSATQRDSFAALLKRLLTDNPDDREAAIAATMLFARQGEGGREHTADFWSDLYEKTGRRGSVARSYASVLYATDRFETCAEVLAGVLDGDEGDFASRSLLLRALVKLNRDEEARARCLVGQAALDEQIAAAGDQAGWAEAIRAEKLALFADAGMIDEYAAFARSWLAGSRGNEGLRLAVIGYLIQAGRGELVHGMLDEWIARGGDNVGAYRRAKIALYVRDDQLDEARAFAIDWAASRPAEVLPMAAAVTELLAGGKQDEAQDLADLWAGEAPAEGPSTRPASTRPASTQPASAPAAAATRPTTTMPATTMPAATMPAATMPAATMPAATRTAATRTAATLPATTQPTTTRLAAAEAESGEALRWARNCAVTLLVARKHYAEALDRADRYLAADPEDHELLMLKSTAFSELGRADDATAAMEAARRMAPDDAMVNNNLAYIYADRGVKLDQAEKMARLALARKPDETAFRDTLGWVFYKQGKFAEAVRVFNQLLSETGNRDKDDPVIYDHAGDAAWRLGEHDSAVKLWRRATELGEGGAEHLSSEAGRAAAKAALKLQAASEGGQPETAPLGIIEDSHED